ncbi:MAG: hypothetical protein RL563_2541, partial [Pseudomonadota bacterium]
MNLDAKIDISGFFRWWLAEILELLPPGLRTFLTSQQRSLLWIRLDNYQASFYGVNQGQMTLLGQFWLHKEGAEQRMAFFEAHPKWDRAEKVLLLNDQQVLHRTLAFPIAVQENLNQVISFELDRYMPYRPEQLYYLNHVHGINKEGSQIQVELVCLAKERLYRYYKELKDWGLSLNAACYDKDSTQLPDQSLSPRHHNLLPEELRGLNSNLPDIIHYGLLGSIGVLLLAVVALPLWLQTQALNELQLQTASARKQAEAVNSLKVEADSMLGVAKSIHALKQQSPNLLQVFDQLSVLLPEDTWLKSFEYVDKKISLQGLTASSSALIELLESS